MRNEAVFSSRTTNLTNHLPSIPRRVIPHKSPNGRPRCVQQHTKSGWLYIQILGRTGGISILHICSLLAESVFAYKTFANVWCNRRNFIFDDCTVVASIQHSVEFAFRKLGYTLVREADSNPHGRSHMLLCHARLPFRHSVDTSMVLATPPLWIPAFAGMTGVGAGNDGAVGRD